MSENRSSGRTYRNTMFTWNNPPKKGVKWHKHVRYAVWQLEKGDTPHLQGYIELTQGVRLSALQKMMPGAHFEERFGTREQCRNYCMKEQTRIEGPWEHGMWISGQGHRTDIDVIIDCLKGGQTEVEISDSYPKEWAKNYRMIDRWKQLHASPRAERTRFHVLWGDPGTGKSQYCKETAPNAFWRSPGPWWDGYEGQNEVILDEIEEQQLTSGELLRVIDRYPLRVPVKGSSREFTSGTIYATSNKSPDDWFPSDSSPRKRALRRRIDTERIYRSAEKDGVKYVDIREIHYTVDIPQVSDPLPLRTHTSPRSTGGEACVLEVSDPPMPITQVLEDPSAPSGHAQEVTTTTTTIPLSGETSHVATSSPKVEPLRGPTPSTRPARSGKASRVTKSLRDGKTSHVTKPLRGGKGVAPAQGHSVTRDLSPSRSGG
jgi:hypothetical protein